MTSNLSILTNCYHISFLVIIQTASGTSLEVNKIGINTPQQSSGLLCIPSALHVPKLSLNSLSISQLTTSGYKVSFNNTPCFVQDPHTRKQNGTGCRSGGFTTWKSCICPSPPPLLHLYLLYHLLTMLGMVQLIRQYF